MNKQEIHKHIKKGVDLASYHSRKFLVVARKYIVRFGVGSMNSGATMRDVAKKTQSFFSDRFSVKQQAFFARRLAFLIGSGVPILESLQMLHAQTKSKSHKKILKLVIGDVANGQALSKSLSRFSNMFNDFTINIIQIGETSGILSQNLNYLAEELKKKQMLRRKIVSAIIYPALVTMATLGITAFLMIYLFPKIIPIFVSLHVDLPMSTRIVIALSSFLTNWGIWFLLFLIVLVIVVIFVLNRYKRIRYWVEENILRISVIGPMIRDYNLANASRTVGLLLKSGINLSSALSITSDTTGNLAYRKQWHEMGLVVNRGERISSLLNKNPNFFPEVFAQMIMVGESTGSLSDSLIYLSEFYEHEVDDFTKDLSSLLEPALMVFMGFFVGFIAISIITPIYGITQSLHP